MELHASAEGKIPDSASTHLDSFFSLPQRFTMPFMSMRLVLVVAADLFTLSSATWIAPSSLRVVSRKSFFSTAMSSKNNNAPMSSLRVLGVCGGIGSGKSRACKLLVDNTDDCVAHLEADSMAHAVYKPGSEALDKIAQEFGSHILEKDGNVNRKELGAIVFSDPSKMATLERIVWPYVKLEIQERLKELRQEHDSGVVVLEAAVLLDAEWDDIMDAVWVVKAPAPIALERLVANRGFTVEEAQKRIDAQEPRRGIGNLDKEVEKGVVTRVIDNFGTEEELQEALQQALQDPTAWKQTERAL